MAPAIFEELALPRAFSTPSKCRIHLPLIALAELGQSQSTPSSVPRTPELIDAHPILFHIVLPELGIIYILIRTRPLRTPGLVDPRLIYLL
jgi:hypothetical protein